MIYQKHWLPYESTPWIHKYTHEEKKKKEKKRKTLDGLAIVGETHALKLENEVL
jgi:hypothetical protein